MALTHVPVTFLEYLFSGGFCLCRTPLYLYKLQNSAVVIRFHSYLRLKIIGSSLGVANVLA